MKFSLENRHLDETQTNVFVLKECMKFASRFHPAKMVCLKKLILEMVDDEWPGGFFHKEFDDDNNLNLLHKDGRAQKVEGRLVTMNKYEMDQMLGVKNEN